MTDRRMRRDSALTALSRLRRKAVRDDARAPRLDPRRASRLRPFGDQRALLSASASLTSKCSSHPTARRVPLAVITCGVHFIRTAKRSGTANLHFVRNARRSHPDHSPLSSAHEPLQPNQSPLLSEHAPFVIRHPAPHPAHTAPLLRQSPLRALEPPRRTRRGSTQPQEEEAHVQADEVSPSQHPQVPR